MKVSKVLLKHGWRCLDCTVCEGCGHNSDEANLLLCEDCDVSYHTYCLNPPLSQVPEGAWRCPSCVYCRSCGTTDPGVRSQWETNYTECGPCASRIQCPVCKTKYQDSQLLLQCEECVRWSHAACDGYMRDADVEAVSDSGYHCLFCRPHTKHVNHPQPRGIFGPLRDSAFKVYAAIRRRLDEQDGQERKEMELQKEKEMAAACKKLEQTLMKSASKKRTDPAEKQQGMNGVEILEELQRIQAHLKEITDATLADKSISDVCRPTVHSVAKMMSPSHKKDVYSRLWEGEELNVLRRRARSESPDSRPGVFHPGIIGEDDVKRQRRHSADSYVNVTETATPLWQPLLTEITEEAWSLPVHGSEGKSLMDVQQSQLQLALQMVYNQDVVMDESLRERTVALKNLYECLSQQNQNTESSSQSLMSREDEHLFHFAAKALGSLTTVAQPDHKRPVAPVSVEAAPAPSQPKRKPKKKPEKRKEPSESTPSGSQPGTPSKGDIPSELTILPRRVYKNKQGEVVTGPTYDKKWQEDEERGELATLAAVLYANVEKPELKEKVTDWSDRVRIINRFWRQASSDVREKFVIRARQNRVKLAADTQRASFGDTMTYGSQSEGAIKPPGSSQKEKKHKAMKDKLIKDTPTEDTPTVESLMGPSTVVPLMSVSSPFPSTDSTVQSTHPYSFPTGTTVSSPTPMTVPLFRSPFPGHFLRPMLPHLPPDQIRALQLAVLGHPQGVPVLRPLTDPQLMAQNPGLYRPRGFGNVQGRPPVPFQVGVMIPRGMTENPMLTRLRMYPLYNMPPISDSVGLAVQQLGVTVPPPQPPNSSTSTSTIAEVSSNETTADSRNLSVECPPAVPMLGLHNWEVRHMPPKFSTHGSLYSRMPQPIAPLFPPQHLPMSPQVPWVPFRPWFAPRVESSQKKKKSVKRKARTAADEQKKHKSLDVPVVLLFRTTVNDSEASTAAEKLSGVVKASVISIKNVTKESRSSEAKSQVDNPVEQPVDNTGGQTEVPVTQLVNRSEAKKRKARSPSSGREGTPQRLVAAPPELMVDLPVVRSSQVEILKMPFSSYNSNVSDQARGSIRGSSKATICLPNPGERALPLPAPRPPGLPPTRPLLLPNSQPRGQVLILPRQQLQSPMYGPVAVSPVRSFQPPRRTSKDLQSQRRRSSMETKQAKGKAKKKQEQKQQTVQPVASTSVSVSLPTLLDQMTLRQPSLRNTNPMDVLARLYDLPLALHGRYGEGQLPRGEDFYNSREFHSLRLSHPTGLPPVVSSLSTSVSVVPPLASIHGGTALDVPSRNSLTLPSRGRKTVAAAPPTHRATTRRVSLLTPAAVSESVSKVVRPIDRRRLSDPLSPVPAQLTTAQTNLAEALQQHPMFDRLRNQLRPNLDGSSLTKSLPNSSSKASTGAANMSVVPQIVPSPVGVMECSNMPPGISVGHLRVQTDEQPAGNSQESESSFSMGAAGEEQSQQFNLHYRSSVASGTPSNIREVERPCSRVAADVCSRPERMETGSSSAAILTNDAGEVANVSRLDEGVSGVHDQSSTARENLSVDLHCHEVGSPELPDKILADPAPPTTCFVAVSSGDGGNSVSTITFPVSRLLTSAMETTPQVTAVPSFSCQQPVMGQSGTKRQAFPLTETEETSCKRTKLSDNEATLNSTQNLQR